MTENEFWEIIEASWADSPKLNKIRMKAVKTNDEELLEELSDKLQGTILKNYHKRLFELEKDAITNFIHILEEKLYKIDREEIHEYTDGSDDGFLYCRCFILAMGKEYYEIIDNDPSAATMDLEAESFGFAAYEIYKKKFGEEFERNSVYCIESVSNQKEWNN